MQLGWIWRLFDWIGFTTYVVLIFVLIKFWMQPTEDVLSRLNVISLIYPFEFILLHSAVFMSVLPKRISLLVLVPFYGLFAWATSHAAGGHSFLLAYFGIIAMRMRFAFTDVSMQERAINLHLSIVGIVVYFAAAIITAICAQALPEWGLTPEFLTYVGYVDEPSEAVIHKPHQVVALTAIYFSLLAIAEIFSIWRRRQPANKGSFFETGLLKD